MELKNFIAREQRALPIFVLADASGSMEGAKINELNLALREMVNALNEVKDIRGRFQLCMITFGNEEVKVIQPLEEIDCLEWKEISAEGNTPMGKAFEMVKELIEDREVVSSRSYAPTIVLISDGLPTDCPEELYENKKYLEWEPLKELHQGKRSAKSQRLALGIGSDADVEMLKAYVNHPEIPVITSKDASGIAAFFQWVTMSTVARMNSVNPNEAAVIAPMLNMDDENIII